MREILVARAIILNEKNEVLLGERAEGTGAGLMELPGGKVDSGEEPRVAAVREVREEVGVAFDPIDLFRTYTDKSEDGTLYKNYLFYGTATGEIQINPHEVRAARFFVREEIVFEMPFNQKKHLLDFFEKRRKDEL